MNAKYPLPPDGQWDGLTEVSMGDGQWGDINEHNHADFFFAATEFFKNN